MEENTQIIRQRLFKTENYLGDFDPNKQGGYDQLDQCSLFGCVWESKIDDNESAPATWDGGDVITPNTQDWRQVSGDYEAWLLNKDKPATTGTTGAHSYNGMGRVVLRKNMVNVGTEADPEYVNTLTQDMFYKGDVGSRVPNTNTVFVIKYDYVLGEDITIPANCVLEFDGGSLSNGTVIGNNTFILYNEECEILKNISLGGTVANKQLDSYISNNAVSLIPVCHDSNCTLRLYSDLAINASGKICSIDGNNHLITVSGDIELTAQNIDFKLHNLNITNQCIEYDYRESPVVQNTLSSIFLISTVSCSVDMKDIQYSGIDGCMTKGLIKINRSDISNINHITLKNCNTGIHYYGTNKNAVIENIEFFNNAVGIYITNSFDYSLTCERFRICNISCINTKQFAQTFRGAQNPRQAGADVILVEGGISNVEITNVYGKYVLERCLYLQASNLRVNNVVAEDTDAIKTAGASNSHICENIVVTNVKCIFTHDYVNRGDESVTMYTVNNVTYDGIEFIGKNIDTENPPQTRFILIGPLTNNISISNVVVKDLPIYQDRTKSGGYHYYFILLANGSSDYGNINISNVNIYNSFANFEYLIGNAESLSETFYGKDITVSDVYIDESGSEFYDTVLGRDNWRHFKWLFSSNMKNITFKNMHTKRSFFYYTSNNPSNPMYRLTNGDYTAEQNIKLIDCVFEDDAQDVNSGLTSFDERNIFNGLYPVCSNVILRRTYKRQYLEYLLNSISPNSLDNAIPDYFNYTIKKVKMSIALDNNSIPIALRPFGADQTGPRMKFVIVDGFGNHILGSNVGNTLKTKTVMQFTEGTDSPLIFSLIDYQPSQDAADDGKIVKITHSGDYYSVFMEIEAEVY